VKSVTYTCRHACAHIHAHVRAYAHLCNVCAHTPHMCACTHMHIQTLPPTHTHTHTSTRTHFRLCCVQLLPFELDMYTRAKNIVQPQLLLLADIFAGFVIFTISLFLFISPPNCHGFQCCKPKTTHFVIVSSQFRAVVNSTLTGRSLTTLTD
jgi:hypothetical protein